jgi:hypothetical protein
MSAPCPYGFRIVGPCTGERRLIDHAAAFAAYANCDGRAECHREAYLSAFTFGQDFREHLRRTGTTKGYAGTCAAPFLWWDIDRADNLDAAREDAARLAVALTERFAVADDVLLLFFSGAKGFHVGLPTALWTPEPSADFHRVARAFCESVAAAVGVQIDTGVYDKVRAFRAPNSRHPATGLHKRRVTLKDLMHLDAAAILALAKEPAAFEIPTPTGTACDFNLPAEWNRAATQAREQAEAKAQRRAAGNGAATLNRATLDFIRDGAADGYRHRLLFSAAANLAEFNCPPALAHALLTNAALDCGLPPSDVRRQIECGLAHGGDAT